MKFGGFHQSPLMFVRGNFQESGIAALRMGLKPRHMEKFRECRLADVQESELTEKKKKPTSKQGTLNEYEHIT